MKVLFNEEKRLFEFRAIGGQVEPCFLERSFIRNADDIPLLYNTTRENVDSSGIIPLETDDKFYEAPETLAESANYSSLELPKFSRIIGLLPSDTSSTSTKELSDTFESFVKAKILIYDQNSTLYNNTDKQVKVTLATLTFFFRRPIILAIMEFINSINIEDRNFATSSESSSANIKNDVSRDLNDLNATTVEEHVVKGFLGKGKSRVMFNLTLKMAQAQILLMMENETNLACLSQASLLMDIKVFPSSFSIKEDLRIHHDL
ncbi:hypothetical protein RYX36_012522 [Vicia faba]